ESPGEAGSAGELQAVEEGDAAAEDATDAQGDTFIRMDSTDIRMDPTERNDSPEDAGALNDTDALQSTHCTTGDDADGHPDSAESEDDPPETLFEEPDDDGTGKPEN